MNRTYNLYNKFLPPPGCEPRSLGSVSRWLIHYATVPHPPTQSLFWRQPYFIVLLFMLVPFLSWSDKHNPTTIWSMTYQVDACIMLLKFCHFVAGGYTAVLQVKMQIVKTKNGLTFWSNSLMILPEWLCSWASSEVFIFNSWIWKIDFSCCSDSVWTWFKTRLV